MKLITFLFLVGVPLHLSAQITISPLDFALDGSTEITLTGPELTADTEVNIDGKALVNKTFDRNSRQLTGNAPIVAGATCFDARDATVVVKEGRTELARIDARYYFPFTFSDNQNIVPLDGGIVEITGKGFTTDCDYFINGEPVPTRNLEVVDCETLRLNLPAARGIDSEVEVEALCTGSSRALLISLFYEDRPPIPRVTRVSPFYMPNTGGQARILGENLTPQTELILTRETGAEGEFEVIDTIPFDVTRSLIILPASSQRGLFGIGARNDNGNYNVSPMLIEYLGRDTDAPQGIEVSFVDGEAEFSWVNPQEFEEILIFRDGELVATLPGSTTFFRDPTRTSNNTASYSLVGISNQGDKGISSFIAALPTCTPPVNYWVPDRGKKNLRLYGEHPPLRRPGLLHHEKGLELSSVMVVPDKYSLVRVDEGKPKFVSVNDHPLGIVPNLKLTNELTTGFILQEETKKLKIAIHGALVSGVENPSLRALVEATDLNNNYFLELTAPKVKASRTHDWIQLEYNSDNPPSLGEPFPDPENPLPPALPLPVGNYKLTLYCVGGSALTSSYTISSNQSSDQIPIPGVGCPPYPLVIVETETTFDPEIIGIETEGVMETSAVVIDLTLPEDLQQGVPIVKATLIASVSDLDENVITNYHWSTFNGLNHLSYESASNKWHTEFVGYGTYKIDLSVEDSSCGRDSRSLLVTIHPPCIPVNSGPNFTYPFPVPDSRHYLTNVASLPGITDPIPRDFRIFVVDDTINPESCLGEAQTTRVQAAFFHPNNSTTPIGFTNGESSIVEACLQGINEQGKECCVDSITNAGAGLGLDEEGNTCHFDPNGARFWTAHFEDLRYLPELATENGRYELRARGLTQAGWSTWRRIQNYDKNLNPIPSSESINVYNKPAYLEAAKYVTATYDPSQQAYDFSASMAPPGTGTELIESPPVPLNPPDPELGEGEFPATQNGVSSAEQSAFLKFTRGDWSLELVRKGYEGYVFGSRVYDSTDLSGDDLKQKKGGGAGLGGLVDVGYSECNQQTLINDTYEIPLVDAPLLVDPYTGGALVKLSFSASIGGSINTQIGNRFALEPFDQVSPFEANLWMQSGGYIFVNAGLRLDILMGIVSGAAGIQVNTGYRAPFLIDTVDIANPKAGLDVYLGVDFWAEICGLWVFCESESWNLYTGSLVNFPNLSTVNQIENEINSLSCSNFNKKELNLNLAGQPKGLEQIVLNTPDKQLDIAASSQGWYFVAVGRNPNGELFYLQRVSNIVGGGVGEWQWPPRTMNFPEDLEDEYLGKKSDPKIVFLDNETVLCAWTQDFSQEDPELGEVTQEDLKNQETFNRLSRNTEIVIRRGIWKLTPDNPGFEKTHPFFIDWDDPVRLSGDEAALPDELRADGKVSLAINSLSDHQIWATWVRYETPDMVKLNTSGEPQISLRDTGIFARRISINQNNVILSDRFKVSSNNNEIDIEPTVSVSPSGQVGIAWVNDPINEDLISSNLGRRILYSRFSSPTSTWSEPVSLISDGGEFPALLEPSLALGSENSGLLAFTALPDNVPESDAGLGNMRLLYTANLNRLHIPEVLVSTPQFIHKKCFTPVFAHGPKLVYDQIENNAQTPLYHLFTQELGPAGSRQGSGSALVSTYSPLRSTWTLPKNLTNDDRVHQGIAATISSTGEIVMIHQSPYPARRAEAIDEIRKRRQKGIDLEPRQVEGGELYNDLLGQSFKKVADAAIKSCRLSDAYGRPGSNVIASIEVVNNGFAPTPEVENRRSAISIRVFYRTREGNVPVGEEELPVLNPGEEVVVEVPLTTPRQPVQFYVEIDEIEGELNLQDNIRTCAFGSQVPEDLVCQVREVQSGTLAVNLSWTNVGTYDRVQVYRDGTLLTELPGPSEHFVDYNPVIGSRGIRATSREYCVRGVTRGSRSLRSTSCSVSLEIESPGISFIRGDCNGDNDTGGVTDAITLLSRNFLGNAEIPCEAACDVNGDGDSNGVTDAIVLLQHNFLGGVVIPAPYPACAISNLDSDMVLGCHRITRCQ